MTEDELVAALDALLESGLVLVDIDEFDEDDVCVPRFRPTARGLAVYALGAAEDANLHFDNAVSEGQ